jgi:hypothetical protein
MMLQTGFETVISIFKPASGGEIPGTCALSVWLSCTWLKKSGPSDPMWKKPIFLLFLFILHT